MKLFPYLIPPIVALYFGVHWPDDAPSHDAMMDRAHVAAPPMQSERVMATVFGGTTAQGRTDGGVALFLGRPISPDDVCVAHRTLPGRSTVWVSYRGRTEKAFVCDRGPYGCDLDDGEQPAPDQVRYLGVGPYICNKPWHVGTHRGGLDMSPRLSELLGFSGRGYVEYAR